jgi:hypothetical protein
MARPQQPELARSAKTDIDPDHVETGLQGQPTPKSGGETGPVPPDNQPGHHPEKEQDKPDLDAFAARLGTDPKAPTATSARKGPRPRATAAKAAKPAPAKPTPAKTASRPATKAQESPAPPPNIAPTPAKRPAASPEPEAVRMTAPQPPATTENGESEPRLVGLMLMPLRETVKRLEQLDQTLTERLTTARRSVRQKVGLKDR